MRARANETDVSDSGTTTMENHAHDTQLFHEEFARLHASHTSRSPSPVQALEQAPVQEPVYPEPTPAVQAEAIEALLWLSEFVRGEDGTLVPPLQPTDLNFGEHSTPAADALDAIVRSLNDEEPAKDTRIVPVRDTLDSIAAYIGGNAKGVSKPKHRRRGRRSRSRKTRAPRKRPSLLAADPLLNMTDKSYEVEAFVDCIYDTARKQHAVCIKWKGYDDSHNTWQLLGGLHPDLIEEVREIYLLGTHL